MSILQELPAVKKFVHYTRILCTGWFILNGIVHWHCTHIRRLLFSDTYIQAYKVNSEFVNDLGSTTL